ncbi:interferon-induced protein 44-like [Brachyhypopomus gauderio]|uniref:interferon-induced protein 44-like n=1 Tax=Brachyhypopomus gauderio TaxID=698409 RepID=UPI00404176D1
MPSVVSSLNEEKERRIQSFFTKPVRLHLLYKSSFHGADIQTLLSKFENGMFVIAVFLDSGLLRGGYTTKNLRNGTEFADTDAFVFEIDKDDAKCFRVLESAKSVRVSRSQPNPMTFGSRQRVHQNQGLFGAPAPPVSESQDSVYFGSCIHIYSENSRLYVNLGTDVIYNTGWPEEKQRCVDVELHRVQELEEFLVSPWREVRWTEETRETMRTKLVSCKVKLESLSRVKALLLGPVGSGKSSLVNSIRSVMYNRVVRLPIVGSKKRAFTKKLTTYDIRSEKGGAPTALGLCDVMGLGDQDLAGLSYSDALAVIQGRVPEGYKFQSDAPISDKVTGYRTAPSLKEQVHCVLFVLDASEVESYSNTLRSTLRELHTAVSELGVSQLILLTHVDQVCSTVEEDVKHVYSSRTLQEKMQNAAQLVGLPLSYVLPVKNYISQLAVDCNTDILLLSVVDSILQTVDDALEDQHPGPIMEFPSSTTDSELYGY